MTVAAAAPKADAEAVAAAAAAAAAAAPGGTPVIRSGWHIELIAMHLLVELVAMLGCDIPCGAVL